MVPTDIEKLVLNVGLVLDHIFFGFETYAECILKIAQLLVRRFLALLRLRGRLLLRLVLCGTPLPTAANRTCGRTPGSAFARVIIGNLAN